jgi:hypothetical protein
MKKTFIRERLEQLAAAVDKEETSRSFGRNIRSVTIDELGARKARRVFTIVKKAKTPKS